MSIKEMSDIVSENEKKFVSGADMKKSTANKPLKGRGRPRKKDEDKATEQLFINVTPSEKETIEAKAKEIGISVSALVKIGIKKILEF